MPRKYERKTDGPPHGGRPPIDDAPVARGVLLAVEGMGRDEQEVVRAAAPVLMDRRAGKSKRIKLHRNAVQRIYAELDRLIAASPSTRGTASVFDLDAIGRHLRRTQSYDDFSRIIALRVVEMKLREWDDGRLALLIEFEPGLPRRILDYALRRVRELAPEEFVPIPG